VTMQVDPVGVRGVHVRILPARAAYLVPDGDREAFLHAVQEASTRWGGATELILPVANGQIGKFDRRLTEIAKIDGLVDMGLADGVAAGIGTELGLPTVAHAYIGQEFPFRCAPNPFSVLAERIDGYSPVSAAEDSPLWASTAAGAFNQAARQWLRDNFSPMQPGVQTTPWGEDQLGTAQLVRSTWLDRTVHHFAETYGSQTAGNLPLILWVTEGDSLDDCLDFWNLRALRPLAFGSMPMGLVPVEAFEHWINLPQQLLGQLGRAGAPTPDVFLTSRSVAGDRLQAIAERMGLKKQDEGENVLTPVLAFDLLTRQKEPPYQYHVLAYTHSVALNERRYGVSIQADAYVSGPVANLRFDSPVEIDGGQLLLRLGGALFDGLPRRPEVAELISSGSTWREDDLQLAHFGQRHYALQLRIPPLADCLDAVLARNTDSYSPSAPGVLAEALASKGGTAGLLEPGVLPMIRQLATPRRERLVKELAAQGISFETAQDLHALVGDWADHRTRTYKAASDLPNDPGWDRHTVLNRLADLSWAERGAEIACQTCRTKTYLPIDSVPARGAPICPACLTPGALTARGGTDPTMFYRLDGLIDTLADQGVLPHLVAMAALQRDHERVWLRPGTLLKLGPKEHEVDILGFIDEDLLYGEVKSEGFRLTNKEIDDDLPICATLGVNVYVLAALDDIPDQLTRHAQEMCDQHGIVLRVLARLDPASPV